MRRRETATRSLATGNLIIEALIVIFLVAIFLALFLPQVQRARATAQRISCLNNLKNISLALQNYEGTHGTFPPGYIARTVEASDPAEREVGPGWAWGALLLPYMEQSAIAQSMDFAADPSGANTVVVSYVCPSDSPVVFTTSGDQGLVTLPPSSFVGVAGFGDLTLRPGAPDFPGMFYRNSSVRLDDLFDGASQTLMIGERRRFALDEHGDPYGTEATWLAAINGAFADCPLPGHDREGPARLVLGRVGEGNDVYLPNAPAGLSGFSSAHLDGVHFARADGSASLISTKVDPTLFRRLGQRADGQSTDFTAAGDIR